MKKPFGSPALGSVADPVSTSDDLAWVPVDAATAEASWQPNIESSCESTINCVPTVVDSVIADNVISDAVPYPLTTENTENVVIHLLDHVDQGGTAVCSAAAAESNAFQREGSSNCEGVSHEGPAVAVTTESLHGTDVAPIE